MSDLSDLVAAAAAKVQQSRQRDAAACASKTRFFTQTSCRAAADEQEELYDRPLFTYRCPACGLWHMTSKKQ